MRTGLIRMLPNPDLREFIQSDYEPVYAPSTVPRTQSLAARSYSESRRAMAVERGLGDNLAKARAAKKAK